MAYPTEPLAIAGIWAGFLLMLMVYSYVLYKETAFFRFAEHTYIAVGLGIAVVTAVKLIRDSAVIPLTQGQIHYVVPILLGVALYGLFWRTTRWVSRYTMAFIVGVGTGLAMRGIITAQIVAQMQSVITPPTAPDGLAWFNYAFTGIGFVCCLMYFILTREHKGALAPPTKLGRYLIMLALGAYYGNTVMFRETMLAGRVEFMLKVLGIIPY